eukprot:CAMPEP_0171999336 /NCGR_PEP_ID=MMETSP1041-20130122/1726_1 /TAXON_ID=464988 /ORGANISM="Hemiselmis andersenii, Strain CCMP439" /LENGTH=61 /DNA_ID=CAMNT_0012652791 /DNA_START=322 /DNA_END=507 /DNA_ORIENTATION=-
MTSPANTSNANGLLRAVAHVLDAPHLQGGERGRPRLRVGEGEERGAGGGMKGLVGGPQVEA